MAPFSILLLLLLAFRTKAINCGLALGNDVATFFSRFSSHVWNFDINIINLPTRLTNQIQMIVSHKVKVGRGIITNFNFRDKAFFNEDLEIVINGCQAHIGKSWFQVLIDGIRTWMFLTFDKIGKDSPTRLCNPYRFFTQVLQYIFHFLLLNSIKC